MSATPTFSQRVTVRLDRSGLRVGLAGKPLIGEGGEGWIIDVSEFAPGSVLKLFKQAEDYRGNSPEMEALRALATRRIGEFPGKFSALSKFALPPQVIVPRQLVFSDQDPTQVVGFLMPSVTGAVSLERYLPRGSIDLEMPGLNEVLAVFEQLRALIVKLHQAGVVIGDFKPANVLVKDGVPCLIDVDSMQFGNFACHGFTQEYVDPKICTMGRDGLLADKPFSTATDWYAFGTMLLEAIVRVSPFGGVYLPAGGAPIQQEERPLKGISVFHKDVVRPRSARSFDVLPDQLLTYFRQLFELGERPTFPVGLLDGVRWWSCGSCGAENLRSRCSACNSRPIGIRDLVIKRGSRNLSGEVVALSYERGVLQLMEFRAGSLFSNDEELVTDLSRTDIDLVARAQRGWYGVLQSKIFRLLDEKKLPSYLGTIPAVGKPRIWYRSNDELWWRTERSVFRSLANTAEFLSLQEDEEVFATSPGICLVKRLTPDTIQARSFHATDGEPETYEIRIPSHLGKLVWVNGAFSQKTRWFTLAFEHHGSIEVHVVALRADGSLLGRSSTARPGGPGSIREAGQCQVLEVGGSQNGVLFLWSDSQITLAAYPQVGALEWGVVMADGAAGLSAGDGSQACFVKTVDGRSTLHTLTVQIP